MIKDLINLIDKNTEIEIEGYCEFSTEYNFVNNFYENPPKKIFIFYLNTINGRNEFIFSKDLDIFDIRQVIKYEEPEEILDEYAEVKILNKKYFALNISDYLDRKLVERIDAPGKLIIYLYDFVIIIDNKKVADNIEIFTKNDRTNRPCEKEKFYNNVVYSKRVIARPGSLEEKLYHFEDVSEKEREIFYKNKKPSGSGGFAAAMKSR